MGRIGKRGKCILRSEILAWGNVTDEDIHKEWCWFDFSVWLSSKTWAGPEWKSELVSECSLVGEEMVLDTEIKPTSEGTQIREFPCYDCISTVHSQIYICNNISNDQCFGRQSSVTFIKGLMSEYIFNYYSSACPRIASRAPRFLCQISFNAWS